MVQWADDSDSVETGVIAYLVCLVTLFCMMLTEPGMMMTNQFERFGIAFTRCDWYLLPIQIQRMCVTFVVDIQTPVNISSYGDIPCERNTSKLVLIEAAAAFDLVSNERNSPSPTSVLFFQILNKAFSFFMILRNLKT